MHCKPAAGMWLIRLVALRGLVSATPFETVDPAVVADWTAVSRPAPDHSVELRVALTTSNDGKSIESHLMEISDPTHSRWRQYLTPEAIQNILRPDASSVSSVQNWLTAHNVESSLEGNTLVSHLTVERAEVLLKTTYAIYANKAGDTTLRTERYSIPRSLWHAVQFVAPTTHFPLVAEKANVQSRSTLSRRTEPMSDTSTNSSLEAACGPENNVTVGPACYRQVYSIDWTAKEQNTTFAIFADSGAPNNKSDLQLFLQRENPTAADAHPEFGELDTYGLNLVADNYTDTETDLDTQTSLGIAWPAHGTVIRMNAVGAEGNYSPVISNSTYAVGRDDFLKFLHDMVYNATVPPIVSFSFGADESYVPHKYAKQACRLMGAASARGVTWIFSSGDEGPISCVRCQHRTAIDPQWPATCPWVLAVGATGNPYDEIAMDGTYSNSFSGGGFSNIFSRPWYQNNTVPAYIANHVDASFAKQPGFNASGRGYPDVAALGVNIPVVSQGQYFLTGGTSASAPAWAAMIALLNDYEASRGKPTLGFVNPWLYSLPPGEGIRDITVCNGSQLTDMLPPDFPIPTVGYNGSVGWDACTGLGVPMFDVLRASLP